MARNIGANLIQRAGILTAGLKSKPNRQGEAREKVNKAIGTSWAFIYADWFINKKLFPLGKIGEIP